MLSVDGSIEAPFDPPAAAGDLAADIAAFTTLEACVEHASVEPFLGDALQAIGYDSFVRDACRIIDAAKARDLTRCDAIDASMLRERCVATVAEVAGDPDACPWLFPGQRERGRDPSCIALSMRDPRMCAGAENESSRATCQAITTHEPAPCAPLSSRVERARCTREARRYGSAVSAREVPSKPWAAPTGSFSIAAPDGAHVLDIDLAPDLSRGIVLVQQRGAARLVVGSLHEESSGLLAVSPYAHPTLAFALLLPNGSSSGAAGENKAPVGANVEHLELSLPDHVVLSSAALRAVTIKVQELAVQRAAPVCLSIDAVVQVDGSSRNLHAKMMTFVRDVVTVAALSGGAVPPKLGVEGDMPPGPKTR